MNEMTWQEMCKVEPRLEDFYDFAHLIMEEGSPYYWTQYENIKAQLKKIVGWHSKSDIPFMRTTAAYDIAHKEIFSS